MNNQKANIYLDLPMKKMKSKPY